MMETASFNCLPRRSGYSHLSVARLSEKWDPSFCENDLTKNDRKSSRVEYEELFEVSFIIDEEPLHYRVYSTVMQRIEQREKKRKLMRVDSYLLAILVITSLSLSGPIFFPDAEIVTILLDYNT